MALERDENHIYKDRWKQTQSHNFKLPTICWEIFLLVECPVPASKSPSQDQLTQGLHEENSPEDAKQVEELEEAGQGRWTVPNAGVSVLV